MPIHDDKHCFPSFYFLVIAISKTNYITLTLTVMKLTLLMIAFVYWAVNAILPEPKHHHSVIKTSVISPPTGSGVYRSAADYKNGKLSLAVDCKTETHKIKLHSFTNKDYIDVIHQEKKHTMKKSEIYGLRDCDGKDWRFSGNKEYQILENEPLLIYQRAEMPLDPQKKGAGTIARYFFSLGVDGAVQTLTLQNLKKATANNHAFHDQLDAQFKSDQQLAAYDSFHKQYKVNHLFAQTTK
jgi:hypothetical protein